MLIKSKKRVKDFGEVFTPDWIVKDMCDLIPKEQWTIESTFLEPTCGNGNFLVEIYKRKLELCNNGKDAIKALASIVGVDIQEDNVKESRERLKQMFIDKYPNANSFVVALVDMVLKNNIICGDSLKLMGYIDKKKK